MKFKKNFYIILLILNIIYLNANIFYFDYKNQDKFQLIVKANIKVYLNNKYQGLFVKELKGVLNILQRGDELKIGGNVYHLKKTIRDNRLVGYRIDQFEKCEFILEKYGAILSSSNPSFPPLQGLPFFPEKEIEIGDIYQGYAKAAIDVYHKKEICVIPIFTTVKYSGKKAFLGVNYDFFEISYGYGNIKNKKNIINARGRHNLKFFFDSVNGLPIYMEDHFNEEFELNNGDVIKQAGFYLFFYKTVIPMNKTKVLDDLKQNIDKTLQDDFIFEKKEQGVVITINNLKFKPNSTDVLDTEKEKLGKLYKMLSNIKKRTFMIIGHTALAGTEDARMQLSVERAKTIANYLIKKGITPDRIIYTGKGAKEPIAPNDTEENMKKNRRVEIIILED